MEKFKRFLAISSLVIMSVITAALAGTGLAIWDMGETVSTVYAYAMPKVDNEPIIKETQTIVKSDAKMPDRDTIVITAQKSEAGKDPNVAIPEQFVSDSTNESDGTNKKDTPANNVFGSDESSNEVDTEVGENTTSDEVENNDEAENIEEESEEEEPIVLTAEIAGIKEIVRAGHEDGVYTNEGVLPVASTVNIPTVAGVPIDYPDPLVDFPREFTEVDMSYFDDALFIGDSRMQGLGMYSKTNATFYAATAFQLFQYVTFKVVPTANGKIPIFDAMQYDKYTKIYIKVGLNELGCVSEEKFLDVYQSFIDRLRTMQPRAIIYIHAVLPVTASKSATDKTHCNEKITARNEYLKAFAQMNNCYYIDASAPFVDENGALREELTADGIHMAGRYMQDWVEYLRKHAVPWP